MNKLIVMGVIMSFALLTSAILAQPEQLQALSAAKSTAAQSTLQPSSTAQPAADPVDWWTMFRAL